MDGFDKGALRVREVEVRPARPDERRRWDDLMREHHYLGFKQFAGRGLRHVAEWRGHWVGLLGWQSGAFKCAPRDRWLGWHRSVQFRRLHLVANNTRFLVLPEASGIPGLASRSLSRSLRRLSGDWEALHGHPLELAETFVDPARFRGTCYRASNWRAVGRTKGFARHNGSYTDPHGASKEMFVRPLRPDARARLSDPADRPEWACRATPLRYSKAELRSLRGEFARLPDCRRGQGRKHRLETVLSIVALARLSGLSGPVAAAQYGAELDADELRALGAWRSAEGTWTAPSAATICRVMAGVDPDALEAALRAWAAPRLGGDADAALAADGKRIRGANRNVEGAYFETVTLVTHGGRPLASRCCRDEGGELAAMRALFEDVDLSGRVLTLDALHACRDTARAIVETHGADYVLSIKEKLPRRLRPARRRRLGRPRRPPPRRRGGEGGARARRGAPHRGARPAAGHARAVPGGPPGVPRRARAHRREDWRDLDRDRLRHHLRARRTRRPRTTAGLEPRALAGGERQPPPPRRQHGRGRRQVPRPPLPHQPRDAQQHRPRRRPPQRLPLPPRGQPPLHDAPGRRVRGRPLGRPRPFVRGRRPPRRRRGPPRNTAENAAGRCPDPVRRGSPRSAPIPDRPPRGRAACAKPGLPV